jgi:hypothetical protein
MPQRLVPPSRRLGAGGLPSHALWRPAPAHIFGADAGTLFLRGPEDGCRCRMSSDAPVTRPGPEPNPRAFLCFLQSETAQLAAYAVFPVHRRQSRRQACRAAAAALPAARASPLADRTLQARQQIWSGSDQIGFHRGTQEHPSSDQSKVQGLPGSKSGPAGFRHAGIDGKALALTSPGVMHAATTRSKM